MKQALVRKGKVHSESVPAPGVLPGYALIKVAYSCISAGTEASVVQASGASVVRRAIEQPERVRKALRMVMSHGLAQTFSKALDGQGIGWPTGYSLAGVVVASGDDVHDLKIGRAHV